MHQLLTSLLRRPACLLPLAALLLSAGPTHAQWVTQNTNLPVNTGITSIDIADANTVWCGGYDGATPTNSFNRYCHTADGGVTWTPGTLTAGAGLNFANLSGAPGGQVAWAAMYDATNIGGFLWRTVNGGTTWTRQLASAFQAANGGFLNGVKAFSTTTAVAIGDPITTTNNWEIYTTTNGTTWTAVANANLPTALPGEFGNTGTLVTLPVAGAATAQPIWFATTQGRVLRSTNSGASWLGSTTGLANVTRLAFSSTQEGLAMDPSNVGLLKRTTDGGATWTTVIPTGPVYANGLSGIPGTPGGYVSTGSVTGSSGSSYSLDGGATWSAIDVGVFHNNVAFWDANSGWSGSFVSSAGLGGISKGSVTVPTGGYCTTGLGGAACDITRVQLVNTTLNTTLNNCPTTSTDFYSSYPASGTTTATVQVGTSYALQVTVNANDIISAWVDWNQNQLFEAGEWVQVTISSTAGVPAVATLTVPGSALLGTTILRIRSRTSGNQNGSTDACSQFGSGETRDYTLNVTSGSGNSSNPAPYCAAPQQQGCTGPSITSVALAGTTLSNVSSCSVNTSGDAYTNYPASGATTGTVQAGQSYQLTVSTDAAASAIVSVWVDWDHNNLFDATTAEWRQVYTTGSGATITLPVPVGAVAGQTRLRIRSRINGSPNGIGDACTTFGSGEAEDYTLTVQATSGNTTDPTPYCAAPQPFGCSGPSIVAVNIAGTSLAATSSCSVNASGTPYFNWPSTGAGAQTATLTRGQNYQLTVSTDATPAAVVSAWVDWNHNLTFDASEWVQVYLNAQNGTVTLAVPASATLGTTRMRIRSRTSGSANGSADACTQFGSGETEDFTITVAPGTGNGSNPAPYCVAPHPAGCGATIITGVALSPTALVNVTGCSVTAAGDAYTNYPTSGSTTGTVQQGQTYPLTVTTDLSAIVSAWADWNHNNVFDANEWIRVYASGTAGTANLIVPATAATGATRLRIRSRTAGSANGSADACTSFSSGETEDYTITVGSCTLAAPTVSAPTSTCAGNTLALTATGVPGGASYLWSGPNSFSSTLPNPTIPNVTTANSGAYTLTITSAGCSATSAPVTVTVNTLPTAPTTTNATRCGAGTLTLTATGAGAGGSYQWYTQATGGTPISGQTGPSYTTPSLSATTTYFVSVLSAAGCEGPRTAALAIVNTAPTATLAATGSTTFCQGGNVTLTATGGGPSATYQWTLNGLPIAGAFSATYIATQAGAYVVTISEGVGCSATSTAVTVTVNAVPSAAFAYAQGTYCLSSANPTPAVTGTPGGTFASTPAGLTLNPATGTITLASSTAGTYTVTYTVGGACPASGQQTVTLTNAPTATFAYPYPNGVCAGAGSPAIYTLSPGSQAGTFSASPAGLTFVTGSPGWVDLTQTTPGTYTITNTVAASGACAATTSTATLLVLPGTTVALTNLNAAYCANDPAVTLTGTINGQPATANFVIDGVAATQLDPATLAPGPHVVTLSTAPAFPGCPGSASLTVTVNPVPATPTISASAQTGGAVLLTSSAATGNQFYLNGQPISGATAQTWLVTNTVQNGTYTVVTTDPATSCVSGTSAPLTVTISGTAAELPGLTVALYPNPTADGRLTLSLHGPAAAQPVALTLYDGTGRAVLTRTLPAGQTDHALDLRALPAGVYTAHLRTAAGPVVRRVVLE